MRNGSSETAGGGASTLMSVTAASLEADATETTSVRRVLPAPVGRLRAAPYADLIQQVTAKRLPAEPRPLSPGPAWRS